MRPQRQRRPVNPEWHKAFDQIRQRTERYGDHLLRINTIEMYEGIDDKPADLIIACNILEELRRPDKALEQINKLALKSAMITVRVDKKRDLEFWKNLVSKYMGVCDALVEDGNAVLVCIPGMRVQGIRPVGALTDDDRWRNVLASIKRVDKRIEVAPAHDRRAIVGCYGPSLTETYPRLQQEAKECPSDIISVSGAHDFLIERGIIPTYHIECDPRPHKADNIKVAHRDVRYLIASNCHVALFDKLSGFDTRLWHVAISEHCIKLVDDFKEKSDWIVSGGGSVGVRSLSLLYAMGYRSFSIYGMDCSFANEGEQQWAGPHHGKRQELCQVKSGDESYISSPVLCTYAANFFDIVQRLPDARFAVYGDGLLQSMCRLFTENKQLEAA